MHPNLARSSNLFSKEIPGFEYAEYKHLERYIYSSFDVFKRKYTFFKNNATHYRARNSLQTFLTYATCMSLWSGFTCHNGFKANLNSQWDIRQNVWHFQAVCFLFCNLLYCRGSKQKQNIRRWLSNSSVGN
jgi:hypothetical protein